MDITTGAMASLLPKLYELLKEKYKLHKGVKKDVQSLSKELASMHAALRKVGRVPREQLDEQVKIWADDVRELSYSMEDVVDTFLVRVEGSEPAADLDGFRSLIKKMGNLFRKGKARHQITDMIKDIKDQVHDAAARRDRYRVDSFVANPDATAGTLDPRLSAMYNKLSDLVGIDEPRDEITKRLMVKNDGVETVSIAGFGGLGKTALAKVVYDSLKAEFHCTAFVSVSQNPEITRIFKKMLHMLDGEKYANINEASWDETQLIDELRKYLQNKRYLIVIDDIWKIESWKTIKHAFVDNSCGSRIIATTRNFDIADQVGGSYKLKPLSLESSKLLFYGRIFGSEEKCPEQLTEVSSKILKKCGGVPLAVITMASLLTVASKMSNPSEWDKVCDSIGSGLGDNPDVKDMRTILSLSYYNLPSHLRTCLLYLGIYPEDYEVPRDDLIWKWIAEGFIPQNNKDDCSLFEVGERYFSDLISRCMIQPCVDDYGEATKCRLHDMMLELICSLSSEENFVCMLDHMEDSTPPQSNARRISLQNKREDHQTTPPFCMSITQVRSVTVFPPAIDLMLPLLSYGVLRVLDLSGCNLGESGHLRLKYIGNLLHLRYLGLQDTQICELPSSIGKLQFLQVLDVRGNSDLREFPESIIKLKRLICLRVKFDGKVIFPDGFGNLTSMEVLNMIPASLNIVKELCNLARLRVLRIGFCNDQSLEVEGAFVESVCKLPDIQNLTVLGSFQSMDLFDGRWVPSQQLRIFDWSRAAEFSTLPSWISRYSSHLYNLSKLRIGVKNLQEEELRVLGRLPSLRVLSLSSTHQTERLLVIGADAFHCLTTFEVYLTPHAQIIFGQGILPRAEQVRFYFGLWLAKEEGNGDFDSGMGNLLSLRSVHIRICCNGVTVGVARKAEAALRHQLHVHPNHLEDGIDFNPPIPQDADEDQLLIRIAGGFASAYELQHYNIYHKEERRPDQAG